MFCEPLKTVYKSLKIDPICLKTCMHVYRNRLNMFENMYLEIDSKCSKTCI